MTTDVNTQFDTERAGQLASLQAARADYQARIADFESGAAQAALDKQIADQVAAGKIEMMGQGRYRSLVGWDRGEIFNVRTAQRPGELTLLEPEAGLDLDEAGKALGLFAQPEWHGLGTVVQGITDVDEILRVSGGDYFVDKRASQCFDDHGNVLVSPDGFQTVRHGGGRQPAILGQVGDRWTVIQNAEGFEFLSDLLGKKQIVPVSAFPLRGGKIYVIACRLPADVIIDPDGIADPVQPYVMFRNSFDGRSPLMALTTPWRPRCSNTERLAMENAVAKWVVPHFKNALRKIEEARRTLGLTVNYFAEYEAEETELARTGLTAKQVDDLIGEFDSLLWPDKQADQTEGKGEKSKAAATVQARRTEGIRDIFATEVQRVGATAYGLERAYTDWLDHAAPRRIQGMEMGAARATAIVEGAEDARKAKVHQRLMLVNK